MENLTLTTEEIAIALTGVQLGQAWHSKQGKSDFTKRQLAALEGVNRRLTAILDYADQNNFSEDEKIMRFISSPTPGKE